jgi:hypothetical protein
VLVRGGTYPQRQWPRGVPASTRPEESRLELRTKARGANDGAGLAKCKWPAQHGTATQRQLKAATSTSNQQKEEEKSDAKRQKSKMQNAATTQLGLESGMQFETQPLAAARLIGRGRQPLQPVQRHRGAVVRPKQRTSSLNKPCRALPSPSKAPSKRPSQAAVVQQAPPSTNHRRRPRRWSWSAPRVSGLEIRVPSPRFASSRRRRGKRETTEQGKGQRARACPCFCSRGGAAACWRCASARCIIANAMLRSFCSSPSVRPAASTA